MKSCFLLFFRTYPNCPLRNYPVKYAEFSWDWSKGAHPDYGFIIHICPTQRFLLFCARLEARLATWDSAFRYFTAAGQYFVDGKKVDIASYRVKPGQVISLREKSKNLAIVKAALEGNFSRKEYVSFNEAEMSGMLVRLPERDEFLKEINEQLIVEFYNR